MTSPQSSHYTITSASGGYALPLDQANGGTSAQVTFNDNHGHHVTRTVPCGNNVADNIQADLVTPIHKGEFGALSIASVRNANRETMTRGKMRIMREGIDLTQSLTVRYKVSGTAVAGEDYKALKGRATIPAGSASTTLTVQPLTAPEGALTKTKPDRVTVTLESVDHDAVLVVGTGKTSLLIQ